MASWGGLDGTGLWYRGVQVPEVPGGQRRTRLCLFRASLGRLGTPSPSYTVCGATQQSRELMGATEQPLNHHDIVIATPHLLVSCRSPSTHP